MNEAIVPNEVIDAELAEPKVSTERENWIAGIRAMADFFEQHPDLPYPLSNVQLCLFPKLDEMRKYVTIFGKAKKEALGDSYFTLNKYFYRDKYTSVYVQATWEREQVCEKVVTGRKKVMQTVQVKPPETIQVETEVETYEWKCPKVAAPPAELIEGRS